MTGSAGEGGRADGGRAGNDGGGTRTGRGGGFVNPYWAHVLETRPRLHDQAHVRRMEVRGRLWYVVEDAASGRQFRLTPEAWYLVGLLDGRRTVREALAAAEARLGEAAPEPGEVLGLLNQLEAAGLLSAAGRAPDAEAAHARAERVAHQRRLRQLRSPLAVRIPLFDPDRLLTRLAPLARALFSRPAFLLWLGLVGYAAVLAALNFGPLTENFVDRVLSGQNVMLMAVVFAAMKLCHEFGHGLAVKRWGGEVHEMGIMLLVLFPVPYVDATAANSFASRRRRAIVAAAGMYVEMLIAAVALILWTRMEPGTARAAMYNAALIGSVSTLLFNLNPLLRFDGYYIFADLASLPNLGTRGQRLLRHLLERHLLGLDDTPDPEPDRTERRWLIAYALAAAVYRVFIVAVIAFFIAQRYFVVGVALALWAAAQMLVLPALGAVRFLVASPRLRERRPRAMARAGLAVAALALVLFLVPVPRTSYAPGVVWVPEGGELVTATDGFVTAILQQEGSWVEPGDVVLIAANDQLTAERDRLGARLRALEARYRAEFVTDRVAARLTRMEIDTLERRIAALEDRLAGLTLRAGTGGRLALAVPEDLVGRYLRRGERLGFVIAPGNWTLRVAVRQSEIGLVRTDLQRVEVLPVVPGAPEAQAEVVRAIPGASTELPSLALATTGGGDVEVAPDAEGRWRALEPVFHFELRVSDPGLPHRVGQRFHVKFVHSPEPLGLQAWRWLRQLFLSRLDV